MPEGRSEARPNALEVFAGWLSLRESGDASEFDDLLRLHPDCAAELAELHASWTRLSDAGEAADAKLPGGGERKEHSGSTFAFARLSDLAARTGVFGRYAIEGEVARGGMGAILRVWDDDLRRHLAMKVALERATPSMQDGSSPEQARAIARFLEEAQVTSQLDHPGIVPVHELGLDSEGRLYFTMKLVEGRDLKQIFELVFEGREGWNPTRALGVVLKVC